MYQQPCSLQLEQKSVVLMPCFRMSRKDSSLIAVITWKQPGPLQDRWVPEMRCQNAVLHYLAMCCCSCSCSLDWKRKSGMARKKWGGEVHLTLSSSPHFRSVPSSFSKPGNDRRRSSGDKWVDRGGFPPANFLPEVTVSASLRDWPILEASNWNVFLISRFQLFQYSFSASLFLSLKDHPINSPTLYCLLPWLLHF